MPDPNDTTTPEATDATEPADDAVEAAATAVDAELLADAAEKLTALKDVAVNDVIQEERNRIIDALTPVLGRNTAIMRQVTTIVDCGFED